MPPHVRAVARPCAGAIPYALAVRTSLESIPLTTIDGTPSSLGAFRGKVRLVVNVASKCGFTPQYAALEALYRAYADRGLTILGFPANEFEAQEPGTDADIAAFCSTTYGVSFPMFSKTVVKGPGQHPLYTELTRAKPEAVTPPDSGLRKELEGYGTVAAAGEILWNFEKFLVDRAGNVVERFAPDIEPDAALIKAAIERELAKE